MQSFQMFSKRSADQRRTIYLVPPGGYISRFEELRIEQDLNSCHCRFVPTFVPTV